VIAEVVQKPPLGKTEDCYDVDILKELAVVRQAWFYAELKRKCESI
jgi:hypothetical protein